MGGERIEVVGRSRRRPRAGAAREMTDVLERARDLTGYAIAVLMAAIDFARA